MHMHGVEVHFCFTQLSRSLMLQAALGGKQVE